MNSSSDNTRPERPSLPDANDGERIAKVIARAGVCSRRDAELLIEEGKVSVNGKTIKSPALNVKASDTIVVEGRTLPKLEPTRLWRYHKPAGLVTTAKDPEGRTTVFERLPEGMPRVVSIGRLDINTEGLLLLTNDGELARLLELPATGWTRRYRVRAWGDITQADLDKLKDGIEVEGVRYGPIEAILDKVQGSNVWLTVGLKEGKHREVKRVLGALGLTVNRLIRLSFGPFQVGDLAEGEVSQVPNRVLMDQLGQHGEHFKSKMEGIELAKPQDRNRSDSRPKTGLGPHPQARSKKPRGDKSAASSDFVSRGKPDDKRKSEGRKFDKPPSGARAVSRERQGEGRHAESGSKHGKRSTGDASVMHTRSDDRKAEGAGRFNKKPASSEFVSRGKPDDKRNPEGRKFDKPASGARTISRERRHAENGSKRGKPSAGDAPVRHTRSDDRKAEGAGRFNKKPAGPVAEGLKNRDRSRNADGTKKFDKNYVAQKPGAKKQGGKESPHRSGNVPKNISQKTRAQVTARKQKASKKPK